VTLIVPDGTNIENLLPGSTQERNSYTWKRDNGASLIMDIAAGQPLASVSYKYVPPASTWLIIAALIAIVVPIIVATIILKFKR
jgi:hypothetical protein